MIRSGYVTSLSAVFITIAHIGLLPYIFFFVSRVPAEARIDIAFIIGPITTAYFLTIVRFALDNRYKKMISSSRKVNFLFLFIAFLCTVPFICALYALIYMYENLHLDTVEQLKRGIGVVELFFGGAFALFVDTVFEAEGVEKEP